MSLPLQALPKVNSAIVANTAFQQKGTGYVSVITRVLGINTSALVWLTTPSGVVLSTKASAANGFVRFDGLTSGARYGVRVADSGEPRQNPVIRICIAV